MKNRKQKGHNFRKLILAILLLLLSFGAVVGSTWAYWDMLTFTDIDSTITLGEGDTLTVTETTASSTLVLIPVGKVATTGETTSRTYTYKVKVNQEAIDAGATDLTVTIDNVKIGVSTTYISLVKFSINNTIGDLTETFATALSITDYTVTIIVTLTEPGDQTVYSAIINQVITFDINFTATIAQ